MQEQLIELTSRTGVDTAVGTSARDAPERNSSTRLRTTCRNATGPRTRTSVGRRGGPSVHNRRAAASRDNRWTYGQPGGWGLSYTATTRTAGSSATMPERSSGSLVRTTQRAEPCRSFAARAVAATSASTVASEAAFPTSRPRPVGGCFGYAFGIEDQQVAQAGRDTTLSSGPGHSRRTYGGRSQRRNRLLRRFQASAWPPSLYAWSRWVMKNVVISTTRGRRSPNAQEVHETAVVDPLEGVRAGVASEPCTKITPDVGEGKPHGPARSLRRRSTAPRVSSTPTDESSHTLGGLFAQLPDLRRCSTFRGPIPC